MPGKVSGRAQYAGDLSLPGMLHAKTKRSNVAHARIKRIDATGRSHMRASGRCSRITTCRACCTTARRTRARRR